MRRLAPRPLARALESYGTRLAPATGLARVQAVWRDVAGELVAAESEPVSERGGTVTVRCSSAVWASELQLLSAELLPRLNEALAEGGRATSVSALRFVSGGRRAGV